MLPACLPMIAETRDKAPGTSGNSARSRTSRPSRTSPRIRIEASSRPSMLPPVTTIPTRLPGKAPGCREHRGDPRGAGALDDQLLAFEQDFDRVFEHRLVDQQNVRDQRLDDAAGQLARLLDRDPLGQGHRARPGTRVLAAHQPVHRRVERRLHADDLDPRGERLGGDRDPRNQPAAADRHDDRVEIGPVGQQFERDRPLAGDDRRVVIGVDKGQAVFAGERLCRFARSGEAVAFEHDLGAERFGVIDFDERRALGHDDRRRDAETPRMIGDALGMVAGRHRDDAGAALRRRSRSTACSARRVP